MDMKKILKDPLTWMIILIIIGLIMIAVLSKGDDGPQPITCKNDEIRTSCDGEIVCAPKCKDDMYFNCATRKCDCKSPNKLCEGGTVCCTVCDNDICCAADNQISVDGKISCCPPGTSPDSDTKTKCLTTCGLEGGPCEINQTCNKLTGLTKESYDNMIKQHSSEKTWRGGKWDDISKTGEVYFCSDPPKCMWEESQALPHSVGDAYPNYDMSALGGEGFNSLCLPKDGDTSCYGKAKSTCDSSKCDWVNILDSYSKDTDGSFEKKLNEWNNYTGKSILGYYCGDNTTPWGRLEKARKDPASTGCKWQDCYNRLANTGTVDILWDEQTNTCSSLKTGNTTGGIQSLVKCKGPGDPCSSCTKEGEYANCIQCNKEGSPCKECEGVGDYVPVNNCTSTTGWKFEACKSGNNKVMKYDATKGANSGNCPWGCNDPNSQECIDTMSDPAQKEVEGQKLGGTSEACFNDGQIKNDEPNYWRAQIPPTSVNACDVDDGNYCQNPGKAICTYSKTPCGEGEQGCYATKSDCERRNNCKPGWIRNSEGTDCNVFKCSQNGDLVNKDVQAGTIAENGKDWFHVNDYEGACIRTNPKVNPNEKKYCKYNGLFGCDSNHPSEDAIGKNYSTKCSGGQDLYCAGSATDTLPFFVGKAGGPEYKFCYQLNEKPYPFQSGDLFTVDDNTKPSDTHCIWGGPYDSGDVTYPGLPIDKPEDGVPKYP